MKLSTKLVGSYAILLAIICGLGLFAVLEMRSISQSTTDMATNWLPSIKAVGKVNNLTSYFRRLELVYLLADPNDTLKYAQQLESVKPEIEKAIKAYEGLMTEPEERTNFPKFLGGWQEFLRLDDQVMELSRQGDRQGAIRIALGEQAARLQEAQKYLDILIDVNDQGAARSAASGLADYASGRTLTIVFVLAALAIGAALAFWLTKNVLGQLGEDPGYLAAVAREVADGHLDAALRPVSGAGGVYGVFVTMIGNLKAKIAEAQSKTEEAARETETARLATTKAEEASREAELARAEGMLQAAGRLEGVVSVISTASDELSSQIDQSMRGSDTQAQRVGETATAMEEMNATVLEVAKNASEAAETSAKARAKAEEGSQAVGRVVTFMEQVEGNARQTREDMASLGKQAENIGQILNVISDIADQTNLLALNAAIEAARAGEAGRGFAVVADEVRKLAEKTMTATKEVGEAIRGIQNGTRKNYENVNQAVSAIEEAATLAGHSGETLGEIVTLVDTTADQVRSIATASEQQSATSDEINRSIEEINSISEETAEAMRHSAQAVESLADQARELSGLIVEMQGGSDSGRPAALPGRRAVKALR